MFTKESISRHRTNRDHVMSAHQGSCGGRGIAALEAGVQPMQVSPCAQGLRVPLLYFPSRFLALPTCSFPLWVSPPGRPVALEGLRPRPSAHIGLSHVRRNGALRCTI